MREAGTTGPPKTAASGFTPPQASPSPPASEESVSLQLTAAGVLVLCATFGWLLWRCAVATSLSNAIDSKHAAHSAALLSCEAWDEEQVSRDPSSPRA